MQNINDGNAALSKYPDFRYILGIAIIDNEGTFYEPNILVGSKFNSGNLINSELSEQARESGARNSWITLAQDLRV